MISLIKLFSYSIIGTFISYFNVLKIKNTLGFNHDLFKIPIKPAKPLVILGTSDSINKITKAEWEEISKSTTIGVNYFLFHDFVPNIIQLELKQGEDEEYFNNLLKILKGRKEEFKTSILLIKSNYHLSQKELKEKISFLKQLPKELRGNLRFSLDFPIPALTLEEYKFALIMLNKWGLFSHSTLKATPHIRASIGLSAALGIKYKVSEIIFAGVDLNHRRTFYEVDYLYDKYQIKLPKSMPDGPHLTNDEVFSELTMIKIFELLKHHVAKNIKFSALSKSSELRKIMSLKKFN